MGERWGWTGRRERRVSAASAPGQRTAWGVQEAERATAVRRSGGRRAPPCAIAWDWEVFATKYSFRTKKVMLGLITYIRARLG